MHFSIFIWNVFGLTKIHLFQNCIEQLKIEMVKEVKSNIDQENLQNLLHEHNRKLMMDFKDNMAIFEYVVKQNLYCYVWVCHYIVTKSLCWQRYALSIDDMSKNGLVSLTGCFEIDKDCQ